MRARTAAAPGPAADAREAAPAPSPRTRPFYWSLRRELWENRFIYLAPLGVGAFAVAGLVVHAVTMPSHMPGMLGADPAAPGSASTAYRVAASLMLLTAFVTGSLYSLEALSSERRDRSILFWKSLPVSDLTTVLAKASIPLVVLPLLTFAVIVAMQGVMLLLSAAALLVQGRSAAPLWSELQLWRMWPALLYATGAMALWHAPVHGFLLLASGWARRTAALWAVLPLLAVGVLEKLTVDTARVPSLVTRRLLGWYGEAFAVRTPESIPLHPLSPLTPGRLLGAPDLWIGLAVAAVCLAAAARLRRHREPI